MSRFLVSLAAGTLLIAAAALVHSEEKGASKVPAVLDFKMQRLDGKETDLSAYKGKVVLIVNVASDCGYTKHYKGLQALHEKFADKGLAVLGFPCNQFGQQEKGTNAEIAQFCDTNYGVKFDMFSKIDVKGDKQAPLYKYLTSKETDPEFAGEVGWNFEKFLVSRDGKIVKRFKSEEDPASKAFIERVEAELAKK